MTLTLQGIRVLDLTDAISGPFSTTLLAGLGAEVIKVESLRHLGFREGPMGPNANVTIPKESDENVNFSKADTNSLITPNFSRYNLDKLSVALNLNKPEGMELFKDLLKVSDIVVDNLSFGVMQKWGFDYPSLSQIKSDIIVVSMPPMGKGPHQQWTTWGMNLLSFTGFAYSWAHADTPMEERAASNTYGDYIAAMQAASTILAALYHRAHTGEGQHIEVVQAEATASAIGLSYLDYFVNDRNTEPRGNRHPRFAPYNSYPCKGEDRWCVIAVSTEEEWQQFCSALESPEWTKDPKYQTMEARLKNNGELDENIGAWTRQNTPHQVMNLLQMFGIAAGAVQNSEDLYYDIQLNARGHMLELDTRQQQNITIDGSPVILSKGQKPQSARAPLLGEHNDYVYHQLLGLTPEKVEQLIEDKIIF